MPVTIGNPLTFEDVVAVAAGGEPVEIASGVEAQMAPARKLIEDAIASDRTVYGITTGIGDLANVRIEPAQAIRLQRDIVLSHATGVGHPFPREVVRAMLLLRARTFAFGVSGVRFELVQRLADFLNAGIHPVVPEKGSLGASGDLAQLAHLALPLIGEGFAEVEGTVMPAIEALRTKGLQPLELAHKEGIALVNGTEAMLALGILTTARAENLLRTADVVGAMTLEACLGTDRAFDEELLALRQNAGPQKVGSNLRRALQGSEIVASHRESEHLVQDAYSLRCIPQVHGAYRDGVTYVRTTLEAELASAIDNPTVLVHRGEVLSGGNFHGEALGLALDHLTLCLTGLATISERRVARIIDPSLNNGLPAFLTTDPGRRSGFMLAQYTAAALTAENRTLSFPASSDSIPTSAGQEDHVSMGLPAARKAAAVLINTESVIAIEALAASQGLELRAPLQPSPATSAALQAVRAVSPRLEDDRPLGGDIESIARMLSEAGILTAVEERIGPLD
ncbi:MAG TPA: histidine ammonia-lyase [Actinomycetota bacterium]|nr:histidine ammonia-lyase [Actinomycetota bacterium]